MASFFLLELTDVFHEALFVDLRFILARMNDAMPLAWVTYHPGIASIFENTNVTQA
jgi:hypothetical protein